MIAGPGATQRGRRQPRGGSHGGGCCCCCVAEAHTNHATSELFPRGAVTTCLAVSRTRKYRSGAKQIVGGGRYAPFHLVDPSLRVGPFSCARAKFGGSHMLFKRALADSLHKAYDTIHSSDSVYKSRVSVASSRPLPVGLVLGGRNLHHCHAAVRACTSATVPVTLALRTPPTSCRRSAMAAPRSRLRRRAM